MKIENIRFERGDFNLFAEFDLNGVRCHAVRQGGLMIWAFGERRALSRDDQVKLDERLHYEASLRGL